MSRPIRRVAILGDGPSGTTLATLLARAGTPAALFSPGQRPEMVVGEPRKVRRRDKREGRMQQLYQ